MITFRASRPSMRRTCLLSKFLGKLSLAMALSFAVAIAAACGSAGSRAEHADLSTPERTAESWEVTVNSTRLLDQVEAARPFYCNKLASASSEDPSYDERQLRDAGASPDEILAMKARVSVNSVRKLDSNNATAGFKVHWENVPPRLESVLLAPNGLFATSGTLLLTLEGGKWKICEITL